ncbi:MAG: hypothetical protein RMJ00_00395 [Nitrososphaerota archaeon]|nr:MAGE domain-containing protein [Candidatus Bathyarchaeota archaeon]MCX8162123.1 MAGE domain-containing protein [Candidatus Bathyarchaeota archaeon]MDW8061150.1 hypothetical protein [Nitrososphaerota archaeon]
MKSRRDLEERARRALQLLLLQRHRKPGVKGWELKRSVGKNYLRVLEYLNEIIDSYGLHVRMVYEEGETTPDQARFLITVKDGIRMSEAISAGWRIDELAILAASVAYIASRQGSISSRELIRLLEVKFPSWFVEATLRRLVRYGYLERDGDTMRIGWRGKAEIDVSKLLELMIKMDVESEG